jgi:hypothetical protein
MTRRYFELIEPQLRETATIEIDATGSIDDGVDRLEALA